MLLPRLPFSGFESRGFYAASLPFSAMAVMMIYWLSEQVSARWVKKWSATHLANAVVLGIIAIQAVMVQLRIMSFKNASLGTGIRDVEQQLFSQTGPIAPDDQLILLAPTQEQDEMIEKLFFTKVLRVALNRYDIHLYFLVYDSGSADSLASLPNSRVLVGVPGAYRRYGPDLNIEELIPEDLADQYQRHLKLKASRRGRIATELKSLQKP